MIYLIIHYIIKMWRLESEKQGLIKERAGMNGDSYLNFMEFRVKDCTEENRRQQ